MSFLHQLLQQLEIPSWIAPPPLRLSPVPHEGARAPSSEQLDLPCHDGKPAVIAFLRHCGCPFAEKTFLRLKDTAAHHPEVHFIAVSHSTKAHTDRWLESVGGAGDNVGIVVDDKRTLYAAWGLGTTGWWHVLSPWALWNVFKLGREEGIWNRPTESGYRWQAGGTFVVDGQGVVKYGEAMASADDVPDIEALVKSLE